MAREAVALGARFKVAQKRINLDSKITNLMTEKIEMPCLQCLKIAFLAKHLFMFNSHGNLITINYCLAFHTVDKKFFQFFVKSKKKSSLYLFNPNNHDLVALKQF